MSRLLNIILFLVNSTLRALIGEEINVLDLIIKLLHLVTLCTVIYLLFTHRESDLRFTSETAHKPLKSNTWHAFTWWF